MTNLEEVLMAIEAMLEDEGGIERDMYDLLSTVYNDPEARSKTMIYLASLEFIKLRAKYEDTGEFMHIHGPLASGIHTLLDIIYRTDVNKMIFTLDRVKEGIIEEQRDKGVGRKLPGKIDEYLKEWK